MSNRLSNGAIRRLEIMKRAELGYCWLNWKNCFALSTEPAVKWLIKKGYAKFKRYPHFGWSGKKYTSLTKLVATDEGMEYIRSLDKNWVPSAA